MSQGAWAVAAGGGLLYRDAGGRVVAAAGAASVPAPVAGAASLNPLLALGPSAWEALEEELGARDTRAPDAVALGCPVAPRDIVDFYASEAHATNAGRLLRPGADPLFPNWRHVPVGYHGRSSAVVGSGTPVARPRGQTGPGAFGPSAALDFEAEIAWVCGPGRPGGGEPPTPEEADAHIFGYFLLNDWSARDIQLWESAPLGPFLGKSFLTSVSPWVVRPGALRRAAPPAHDVPVPEYLAGATEGLDVSLAVELNGEPLATMNARNLYWTPAQMTAHALANGAALTAGDVFASGTVSEEGEGRQGCLLELWKAERWLADGDEVVIRGDLGEVAGRVVG